MIMSLRKKGKEKGKRGKKEKKRVKEEEGKGKQRRTWTNNY